MSNRSVRAAKRSYSFDVCFGMSGSMIARLQIAAVLLLCLSACASSRDAPQSDANKYGEASRNKPVAQAPPSAVSQQPSAPAQNIVQRKGSDQESKSDSAWMFNVLLVLVGDEEMIRVITLANFDDFLATGQGRAVDFL